ncbi:16S rRNA (adenine(1518)-N(6)/adenine(1519)-N(6))-dimethyltransferase RsmA [Candidatus Saccharibacteria bacterium]|nr:16S rRNA (adenine(1518)-N(6)/adenine(1519)-N(6))-dimethyltransferase RsmA [Candidatus Saccharibacteria bacterium]
MMGDKPNKNLGQHWLRDRATLEQVAAPAELTTSDTVLEIGPGLGTLTRVLADHAGRVIAVEFDRELADELEATFASPILAGPGPAKVEVINADFLQFDLNQLPAGYKVVANIPYYITNKIIMKLLTSENKPGVAVLLVQKEVAERLAAKPGQMSILSVAAQFYADVELGIVVTADKFDPPPKVDSQVVILHPHLANPILARPGPAKDIDEKQFFRIVRAGFSQRRKKLHTALAGGLNISTSEAKKLLQTAGIDSNLRAQDLTLSDWHNLVKQSKIFL